MFHLAKLVAMIVLAVAAAFIMGAGPSADRGAVVRYDGYKLVRAYPQSQEQIDALHELDVLLMSDGEGIGPVIYLVPPDSMASLDAMNLRYQVLKDDVQKDIDAERQRLAAQGPVDPRDRGWFDDFKDLSQIVDKLQAWLVDYPDLTELVDIGDSIESRDIWAFRITGPGDNKPGVLFNATQHAREWIAPMVDMYLADQLLTNYGVDPEITALVDAVEIWFIPVVNPDGYSYTWTNERYWRKNRRDNENSNCWGVDLNRNWELGWGGSGSSGDPCSETYRGTGPFSEPETQAMAAFYLAHPNMAASIDLHSHGEQILYPWAYKSGPCDDDGMHQEVGEVMQDLVAAVHGWNYMLGSVYDDLYPAAGGSVDWTWGDQGVLSYTIELRGPDFVIPPSEIIPNSEEILPAALYLTEWCASPVHFSFPDGLPTQLEAGVETHVAVTISVFAGSPIEPGTENLFYRVGSVGPFTEEVLTPLGGEDYEATLPALNVGQTIQFYFQVRTTDNSIYTSPVGAPDVLYEAGVFEVYYRWDLDGNPGWSTEGQWAWGHPTGQGGNSWGYPDPTSGFTGDNVCGYNLNGDYSTNVGGPYYLTTGTIDCSELTHVTLSFYRWLNSDYQPYAIETVDMSNDGSNWVQIWSNGGEETAENSWSEQEYDISSLADEQPTVFIRWGHEIGSVGAWAYSGWNIDDIEIRGIGISPCHGDVNNDGAVDIDDLFEVLGHWGEGTGPYDLNDDGTVDIDDLFEVLANWGPC